MIIIFGSTGFLGSSLTQAFSKNNHVIGISSNTIYDFKHDRDQTSDDLNDILKENSSDSTHIFCASMRYSPKLYRESPVDVYIKNMAAFFSFMELLIQAPPKRAILTSSFAVYGVKEKNFTESELLHTNSFSYGEFYYASAKLHQEQIFIETCKRLGIDYSVVRIPGLYGPNATLDLDKAHVLPAFIMKALSKTSGDIDAFGTGHEKREFLYVPDLIRIYEILTEKSVEIINISNQQFIMIKELAKFVETHVNTEVKFKFKGAGVSDIKVREVSSKAFLEAFPCFQFSSFEEGLKNTINWYVKNFRGS